MIGTGIAFEVISMLQDKYKFNYTVIPPEDNVFLTTNQKMGARDLIVNNVGKRHHCIIALFSLNFQEADIVAAFLPIMNSFHGEIWYSRGFDTAEWVVLMKRPRESATGSGLLAPFTTSVWILIILSLLVVGPIIYLLVLLQARLCKDDNNKVYPLPACVWFVYGALLKQGTTLSPATGKSENFCKKPQFPWG